MFHIGATELLMIVIVAVLVIGPKDMPLAFRTAGRWVGKMRKLSAHFRTGLDAMVREAELDDMEKKWKAQNEKIMREHPDGVPAEMEPTGAYPATMTPAKAQELKITAPAYGRAEGAAGATLARRADCRERSGCGGSKIRSACPSAAAGGCARNCARTPARSARERQLSDGHYQGSGQYAGPAA